MTNAVFYRQAHIHVLDNNNGYVWKCPTYVVVYSSNYLVPIYFQKTLFVTVDVIPYKGVGTERQCCSNSK